MTNCACECGRPVKPGNTFLKGHHPIVPLRERLLSKLVVDLDGPRLIDDAPCWIWTGSSRGGYGYLSTTRRDHVSTGAHRLAWEIFRGPIPAGYHIDHLCRTPLCCNPAHLEPVTPQTNTLRGNGPTAANASKTHCVNGHEYDLLNTAFWDKRGRACRACTLERNRQRRAAISEAREATL